MTTRRAVLLWTVAMLALPAACRTATEQADTAPDAGRAEKPLDILFLGGTGFLGPHQIEYALARGHNVTIFNRGQTAKGLLGDRIEVLIGNRDAKIEPGLTALQGDRRWDIVIDNSGYVPRHVRDSVALLKDRVGRYVYVSTVAVYDSSAGGVMNESSPMWPAPSPEVEEVTGATYGPLKAECDRIVQKELGARATIVRPTYIFGPGDETDRFTYWVDRVSSGGEVLGPPDPKAELQWVDVRDLCPWIVQLGERDQAGIYNASGPTVSASWGQVLQSLTKLSDKPVQFRWATADVLKETGIRQPLVRQAATPGAVTVNGHFDGRKAEGVGLRYRPLADTAEATLAWWRAQTPERRAKAENWPKPEQEQKALALLRTP
ncbi:MAG: NAD-dependent epimerase/dehydratase family protein [Planctomycetota bacterium]|nr:NAD-dependent epimerase/dehydratase family protein [Planctomycetota bacterium]